MKSRHDTITMDIFLLTDTPVLTRATRQVPLATLESRGKSEQVDILLTLRLCLNRHFPNLFCGHENYFFSSLFRVHSRKFGKCLLLKPFKLKYCPIYTKGIDSFTTSNEKLVTANFPTKSFCSKQRFFLFLHHFR